MDGGFEKREKKVTARVGFGLLSLISVVLTHSAMSGAGPKNRTDRTDLRWYAGVVRTSNLVGLFLRCHSTSAKSLNYVSQVVCVLASKSILAFCSATTDSQTIKLRIDNLNYAPLRHAPSYWSYLLRLAACHWVKLVWCSSSLDKTVCRKVLGRRSDTSVSVVQLHVCCASRRNVLRARVPSCCDSPHLFCEQSTTAET